ncbi:MULTISPECIES: DUF5343 domain-containing protein [unclassified Burkholderia]|uniref:DUF5343 domain-containing protein n=1 Tax=unclassified Burkholderia TaxID=2613784 RepID=UPI000F5929FF|nr:MULTISPECIES: DUF5343 domain-containing protein [unclassified Burkholderia]
MPDQYPFIVSNNKIEPILSRIRTAAKPEKLSQELLATWGFTASNDRAMPRVLKALGFLTENGVPTAYYDRLRDPSDWKRVLGERVRETYADLFAIDSNIQSASEAEVKGAISRITGKDEEAVKRYYSTFKTLARLADFSERPDPAPIVKEANNSSSSTALPEKTTEAAPPAAPASHRKTEYHYNIQIHLPVTTDITVYNAIFKSLRDNLGV